MALEIPEITDSNQDYLPVIMHMIDAQHAEIHECLRLLRKHDAMLEEFRPLLNAYRTPLAAGWAARKAARNAVPQNTNGQVQEP